jgi:hypothetical protein
MLSQARISANRENARKSTGPRTEQGKDRVRLNALKHGMAAETVVLPHEDVKAFEQRLDAWTRELAPNGDVAGYLAERAAKLSWQLDRADACEHAVLAKRTREAPREKERSRRRRASEQLRLLLAPDPQEPVAKPKRSRLDRLARLKASAHGCRALFEAWSGVAQRLADGGSRPGGWASEVQDAMLRLLGVANPAEAARLRDPSLQRIVRITAEARKFARAAMMAEVGFPDSKVDGEEPSAQSPYDDAAARCALLEIVAAEQERLVGLIEELAAENPDPAAEDAARASFDDSPEGERLHRYQNQWGRALLQTLKAIAALGPQAPAQPDPAEEDVEGVATSTAAAPEQSQAVEVNDLKPEPLRRPVEWRSRAGRGRVAHRSRPILMEGRGSSRNVPALSGAGIS